MQVQIFINGTDWGIWDVDTDAEALEVFAELGGTKMNGIVYETEASLAA